MKKIIAILLTQMMVVGMVACGNNVEPTEAPTEPPVVETLAPTEPATEPPTEAPTEAPTEPPIVVPELSTDWTDFEFAIDDKAFALPVAYSELKEATGYQIPEEFETKILEPGLAIGIFMMDENGDYVLDVQLMNNTNGALPASECVVQTVRQNDLARSVDSKTYRAKPFVSMVYVANNLSIYTEVTRDDLIEMFGEPNNVEEHRTGSTVMTVNDYDTYCWYEEAIYGYKNVLKIDVRLDTNEINYIELSNYDIF